MPTIEVTRTYLEMTEPPEGPDTAWGVTERVERVTACPPSFYRFLYAEVGRAYHWLDRASWSDDQIRAHVASPGVELLVLYVAGAPAGYCELAHHEDESIEIAYFGLLPEFQGRGLGRRFLEWAIRRAWGHGARRLWLHTCSLDGPGALPNYLARGFRPFKTESYEIDRT